MERRGELRPLPSVSDNRNSATDIREPVAKRQRTTSSPNLFVPAIEGIVVQRIDWLVVLLGAAIVFFAAGLAAVIVWG